jgi:acyl-CoA reductase-like NAD-dependent aldehyde dehydrogenase
MSYNIWVNGAYRAGTSGEVIEVRNPATEEVIDTAPAANAADVDAAIAAAHAAFPSWKKRASGEKAEMLHEVAQKLTACTDELARLLTLEGGKPLVEN